MIAAAVIVLLVILLFRGARSQVEDAWEENAAEAIAEGKEPVDYATGSSAGDTGCLLIATVIVGLGITLLIAGALPAGILLPR